MRNSNIELTKTEKIKFAYRLFKEETSYDNASKILRVSRRTYANWVKSFKMIGLKRAIKEASEYFPFEINRLQWDNGSEAQFSL